MGTLTTGIFAALLLTSVIALPSRWRRSDTALATQNFVGDGTNELATAILQGYVDSDENLAFSPLGYSALLAILAEGARGESKEQLVNALHLPESLEVRRTAYKNVLQRFTEKNTLNKPEFRNWFYIYKNFSVEPDFKTILLENYLTEVKDVDRLDSEDTQDNKEEPTKVPETTQQVEEKPEEITFNKEKDDVPTKSEGDKMAPIKIGEILIPVTIQEESKIPEKPYDSQINEDVLIAEKIDESEPSEDSMPSEKNQEKEPERNEEKEPEKNESFESSGEPEETMQLSDVENPKKEDKIKDIPMKTPSKGRIQIVVPPSYVDYSEPDMNTRNLSDEKETKPSGEVITMQQEMLGTQKDNDNMEEMKEKDEKMEETITETAQENKKEDMKDVVSTNEDKKEIKDEKKAETIEKIKEGIMETIKKVMSEDMKESMEAAIKDGNEKKETMSDSVKDEKKEEMQDQITEEMKGEKMDDKMTEMNDKIKEDNVNSGEGDVIDSKKDEKKEIVEGNKNGEIAELKDKSDVMKDEMKEDKKDDEMMAGAMMEDAMKVNPIKEEELIKQAMKEDKETMMAMGRNARALDLTRVSRGAYLLPNDISSSLSGNNIVVKNTKSKTISQILAFNGMYFKGEWAKSFSRQKEDSFYKSDNEKSTVTMMGTQGSFRVGNVPDLDSIAIELPYKDERYSLLVVMPNSRTGLRQLISDLTGYPLRNIQKNLESQEVEVCLPKFEIQSLTKPIDALRKFGVSDIFNPEEADLSGISKVSGLFVEELVQLVTVKVDEGSGAYNHMTASNPSTRTGISKFVADHPFLYFVRDTTDNLIVVAGKVVDPSVVPKDP